MDLKQKLQSQFVEVKDVFFEKEAGVKFLRVETSLHSFDEVVAISKRISNYLDEIDTSDQEYYLDVYSAGTDTVIDLEHLGQYLEHNVQVSLNQKIKDLDHFEGRLLIDNHLSIVVQWNAKGQLRKQEINKDNIKSIKLSAKTK